jgi:ribosomal protein L33
MKKMGYVYVITSKEHGQQYVGFHASPIFDTNYFGSPISLSKGSLRSAYQTIWPSDNYRGYLIPSFKEFSKYFTIEVLQWCDSPEALFQAEHEWIKKLDTVANGFNRHSGGMNKSAFGPSYIKYCETCNKTTKWKAGSCYTCAINTLFVIMECDIHGETLFQGSKCAKCVTLAQITVKYCEVCTKNTKHRSNNCYNCFNSKSITFKNCQIHGRTKFLSSKCRKCISSKAITDKFCTQCNVITKHNKASCINCLFANAYQVKICEIHGETKFHGAACCTCTSRKRMAETYCDACEKITTHRGQLCFTCAGKKTPRMKP